MNVMGIRVHYRYDVHPGDSTPLVLVHGTSSSLHTWDSIVPDLRRGRRIGEDDLHRLRQVGSQCSGHARAPVRSGFSWPNRPLP